MTRGWRNWQAALAAWVVATLLVGGGYALFQAVQGGLINWRRVAVAAGLAGIYALYLAVRFRERPAEDGEADAPPPERR